MRQSGCWVCLVGYYIVNPGRTFPQARPYYISVCTCARLNHSSEEDCADAEDNQTPPQRTTAHCTAQLRNVLRSAIESGVVVLKHTLCIMQLASLFLLSFFFFIIPCCFVSSEYALRSGVLGWRFIYFHASATTLSTTHLPPNHEELQRGFHCGMLVCLKSAHRSGYGDKGLPIPRGKRLMQCHLSNE